MNPLHTKSRELKPAGWFARTGNWSPIGADTLNPERAAHLDTERQHLAA